TVQPVHERLVAGPVVGEAPVLAITHAVSVEMGFRDVDADGIVGHLSLVLCLSSAAELRVSVQAARERRGRSHSSSTRQTVGKFPIRPSPLQEGGYPPPAVPSSPVRQEKS